MVNAQQWLDEQYPQEQRSSIKSLHIGGKNLEGSLDLMDFVNLELLVCSYNQLTSLNLQGLKKLKSVSCCDNFLNNFDYSSLNPSRLTYLNITDNNFPAQDLSVFSRLNNLRRLLIGGVDEKKFQQGIYNRFHGSLKPLKNLTKLKFLHISNTDVDSGVEFLPNNLVEIRCSFKERPESEVKKIAEQLDFFIRNKADIQWENIHPEFSEQKQKEWQKLNFDCQETKEWIKVGLHPDDYHFASYLRKKGYQPHQNLNWEELRKENRSAQEWLDNEYPLAKREWENWLDIGESGLEGDLIVADFPNLERINCSSNQLTSITLKNLPKLTYFETSHNKLSNIVIGSCPEIRYFSAGNNCLTGLDFLKSLNPNKLIWLLINNNNFLPHDITIFREFTNLDYLYLAGNDFYGSLEPLRNFRKLRALTVVGTDIEEDLEYLPDSLERINSNSSQNLTRGNEEFKLLGSWELAVKSKGKITGYRSVPYFDFRYWKENQPYFKWLKEEIEKLNPNLNVEEVVKNIFFNVKTGEFIGNFQATTYLLEINKVIIEEKEKLINDLGLRIQELTNLIKKQKEKIVNAYLRFTPEKELLQKLIETHLRITKFRKKETPFDEYESELAKYDKIEDELKNKLKKEKNNRELKEKIKIILSDCEELVTWETELENKINTQLLLIEEQKIIPQLTISNITGNVIIGSLQIEGNADFSYYKQIATPEEKKLSSQQRLSDKEIDWAYRQIKKELNSDKYLFYSTLQWNDIVIYRQESEYFDEQLGKLVPEKGEELDFIPINNSDNHSLLVYEVESAMFYHLDSSQGKVNGNSAKEIAQEILKSKGLPVDNFQELECAEQADDWGIELIAFAEKITREYNRSLADVNLCDLNLAKESKYWRERLKKQEQLQASVEASHKNPEAHSQVFKKTSSQLTKINSEINEIEKKIENFKKPLENGSVNLVEKFIEINKKIIKDKNNDGLRSEIKKVHEELEEKEFSREVIEKIIRYCERLVDLEWQTEQWNKIEKEQITQIEIPPK